MLGYEAGTRAGHQRDLGDWFAFLESHDVDPLAVSRGLVDAYRQALLEPVAAGGRGLKDATVARRLACLSAYYAYAVDEGLVANNPVARVRRPRS